MSGELRRASVVWPGRVGVGTAARQCRQRRADRGYFKAVFAEGKDYAIGEWPCLRR
jgi:hypothetical protein